MGMNGLIGSLILSGSRVQVNYKILHFLLPARFDRSVSLGMNSRASPERIGGQNEQEGENEVSFQKYYNYDMN